MEAIVAIKSHWLWLQDMIWETIPETKSWNGDVALLEEDHVVTPDYLQMLTVLLETKTRDCPRCWGVCVRSVICLS